MRKLISVKKNLQNFTMFARGWRGRSRTKIKRPGTSRLLKEDQERVRSLQTKREED